MKKLLVVMFLGFLLVSCATSPGMQEELTQGKITFTSGDYQKSFRQLLPVAVNGNKEAQYAIGYMYYNGLGVTQDSFAGSVWMKRSAEQHYPPAEKAVKELNQ